MEKSQNLANTETGVKHEKCENLGYREIIQMLPHRPPFLLVDRVLSLDTNNDHIIALKAVTINEPFFQGHFPSAPIMPGVLVLEALAQVGGILIYKKGYRDKIPVIMGVNNAKFRRPVRPGDVLHLHCHAIRLSQKGGRVRAVAKIGESVATEADISFALLDQSVI